MADSTAVIDVTGFCQRDRHQVCTGILRSGTGHHWFCACDCHPEPEKSTTSATQRDFDKAHATWQAARRG